MKKVKIALLGLGNVGRGVWMILNSNKEEIRKRSGYEIEVAKILVRDINKDRGFEIPDGIITDKFKEIIDDDSIKIIVEVMGGVEPAREYMLEAMSRKKHIITANKMLLATGGDELFEKADKEEVMFKYEASVAGGIPIINGINESLTANKVERLYGIVNGTTNYILTKMDYEALSFKEALKEAKEKGYAEADPTSDIEGYDSQYKLSILSSLAFGTKISVNDVYREGITKIEDVDMDYAKEFKKVIKLLAIVKDNEGKLELRVHPTMIPENHPLANVNDSFNAVLIRGNAVGDLMFYGRGAGDLPTGSAVVSDIVSILRSNIDENNSNKVVKNNLWEKEIYNIDDIYSEYYVRLTVEDRPGVLGEITSVFGNIGISLRSVIQKGIEENKVSKVSKVTLVLVTHKTKEEYIKRALENVCKLNDIYKVNNLIRMEDFN